MWIFIILIIVAIIIKFLYERYMMLEKIESNGGILIKYNTLLQYMLMPPNSEIVSNAKDHINVVWRGNGVNTYFTITPAFKVVIVQWEFKGGGFDKFKTDLGFLRK